MDNLNMHNHYILAWAWPTVRDHMQSHAKTTGWGGTYTCHKQGIMLGVGDEIFDCFLKDGQLWVMTNFIAAKVYVKRMYHYTQTNILTDAFHVDAVPGANPIRFDVSVSPTHMQKLRYINADGMIRPFAIGKNGMLVNQALRMSVIQVPDSTADMLRAYANLPQLI